MSDEPAIEPDEILPPGHEPKRKSSAEGTVPPDVRGLLSSLIARWLDDLLPIPGTRIRLGLDPILALIPGLGDAAVTGAGAAILFAAVRHRAPVRVLVRMAGNMVVNALLNVVPFAGPALSIWFKSNSRNNAMLQRHISGLPPGPASPQSRLLMAAVVVFIVGVLVLNLLVWWFVVAVLWKLVHG